MNKKNGFNTSAIHSGERVFERAVTQPIFQSSTYVFEGEAQYLDVKYGRLNNTPNHQALGEKIATLEKAEDAIVTSSGMAAITAALLSLIESGGHLLAQDNLYGGTYYFLKDDFPFWGREVTLFPTGDSRFVENYIRGNTKAIYVETISNPLLKIPDFEKIVSVAHKQGALAIIDNTFASPYNFNPIEIGFDIVLHSATKYLNGHTDVLAGAIAGKREVLKKVRKLVCHLGPTLDPHACFLLNRGIKTLGLRMREHNANALELARFLQSLKKVERVYYPGLEEHPDHQRAKQYFKGFGGMVSFEFRGTPDDLETAMRRLTLPFVAPSLGGVESLITRPSTTSHSGISIDERSQLGIKDNLVRFSVGLEDVNDLKDDFREAFGG
ncbi:MAG: trans-sulfuration enzyme family protein [Pseudomonadota bacterium]